MGPGQIALFVIIGLAAIALLWVLFAPKKSLLPAEEQKAIDRPDEGSPNWEEPADDGAKVQEPVPA